MVNPRVMGVVNVTPDSFSDGGRFFEAAAAVAHGHGLAQAGADILDIGGESTRPGAEPLSEADELARVLPVLEGLRGLGVPLSIDTYKPAVARAAVAAGASVWNDIGALAAPGAPEAAAELGCTVVLMHMQGDPRTMQSDPRYGDVVAEVSSFLRARAETAMAAGVERGKIWLDPGIGFGKRAEHNLALIKHLDRIKALGFPVVLGLSRKRFIESLSPGPSRLGGSLAGMLAGAARGADVVRVHDVAETVQALALWRAVEEAR